MARACATTTAALQEALRYVILDNGQTAASGDYHDDAVTSMAIGEQMRLWAPTQVEVVSLAQELCAAQLGDPYAPLPALESAMAGGSWAVRNSFGRTIDPWSPTGFAGVLDDRY